MDRKGFLRKTCLAGVCGCGFGALTLKADDNVLADQETVNPMAQPWLINLLENLDKNIDAADLRKIIKMSAGIHYDQLKMDDLLSGYTGKLGDFTAFLEKEWGWKLAYDESTGVIMADENKTYCVCPVLKGSAATASPAICYCSEGFAERIFSRVVGVPVTAQVVSSVRRGDASCVYRIEIPSGLV